MSTVRRCGADALLVDCADGTEAMRLWRRLQRNPPPGVTEVVPGAVTVLVVGVTDARRLQATLQQSTVDDEPETDIVDAAPIEVPVRYDGADLGEVAAAVGMEVGEVVRRHHEAEYTVAFAGFTPGFGYLTGLDPALVLPRRHTPRTRVPAGAVAIADAYTGVYPTASPGGWHLLGSTDAVLFDVAADPPALLRPGAQVRFRPRR